MPEPDCHISPVDPGIVICRRGDAVTLYGEFRHGLPAQGMLRPVVVELRADQVMERPQAAPDHTDAELAAFVLVWATIALGALWWRSP